MKDQLIEYITFLGSAESLYMTEKKVRTMCMGSHRCELFFGSLRRLSNFHHTSQMGIDIIMKYILLMYLDTKYEDHKNVNRLGDDHFTSLHFESRPCCISV